jgi:hypothetical protein
MNMHTSIGGRRRARGLAAVIAVALLTTGALVSAGPKGADRPFRGSCDTAITPLSEPEVIPIVLAVDVVCRLSHLGLTVGGTGRFAGASGQVLTSGEGSLVTNTGRLTTSGTVRY